MSPRNGLFSALVEMTTAFRGVAAAVAVALLASCGGGGLADLAGGVGSGGSGLAEGTITGFGSVYVDGVRYDDSRARKTQQAASGEQEVSVLKLGQRVRVRTTAAGVADSIEVMTELIGPIESVDGFAGGQWLTVLGQRVRVDRLAVGGVGADTWVDFGGSECVAAGTCSLQRDQWVQVHGTWVLDSTNRDLLVASRVEVIVPQANVLLSGVVRQLNGQIARLNAPDGREVDLTGSAIGSSAENEQLLRVWAPADTRAAVRLPAARAIASALAPEGAASGVVLGGEIAKVNADGSEIEIQGVRIAVPQAMQLAKLDAGRFARVEIERGPGGWQLKAAPELPDTANRAIVQIGEPKAQPSDLNRAQLGFWALRDTLLAPVTTQQLRDGECLGAGLGAQFRIDVKAVRGPLPMRVDSIRCSRTP